VSASDQLARSVLAVLSLGFALLLCVLLFNFVLTLHIRKKVNHLQQTVDEVVNAVLDKAFEALAKEHTAESAEAAAEQHVADLQEQLRLSGIQPETLARIQAFYAAAGTAAPPQMETPPAGDTTSTD
jgi:hypothetical protein